MRRRTEASGSWAARDRCAGAASGSRWVMARRAAMRTTDSGEPRSGSTTAAPSRVASARNASSSATSTASSRSAWRATARAGAAARSPRVRSRSAARERAAGSGLDSSRTEKPKRLSSPWRGLGGTLSRPCSKRRSASRVTARMVAAEVSSRGTPDPEEAGAAGAERCCSRAASPDEAPGAAGPSEGGRAAAAASAGRPRRGARPPSRRPEPARPAWASAAPRRPGAGGRSPRPGGPR